MTLSSPCSVMTNDPEIVRIQIQALKSYPRSQCYFNPTVKIKGVGNGINLEFIPTQ
jgi:hypothetical protein